MIKYYYNRRTNTLARQKKVRNKNDSVVNFNDAVKTKRKEMNIVPKTLNQEKYILNLLDERQDIVIVYGPAGGGKTYLAMQAAIKSLKSGICDRIILTRPAVGVEDESHGFLPGTLEEKMAPWTRPLLDVLREYYAPHEITGMLEDQIVEITPLAFMRGRSLKKSWIICDEFQNATPNQVKMLLTRIGEGSKIVVTGDVEQTDKKVGENGLIDLCNRLESKTIPGIAMCELTSADIQRHPIINAVLDLYKD